MRVGVDLGGTKIYAIAVADGQIVAEVKSRTPAKGGPLAVVDAIEAAIRQVSGASPPEAIGIGAPGTVDHHAGVVLSAPNLQGWLEPFPLRDAVSERFDGLEVVVDNDVNVGTLAEHRVGAGTGADDLLGVFVGTGVGGALILDGDLRRGPHGIAGEIGHVVIRPGGRRCGCGGRGHLEAYAGRAGMERRARQMDGRGRDTRLVELAPTRRMTSSVFASALAAGDRLAVQLVDRAIDALGQAISGAVTLLDVSVVVMGGGLADRLGADFVGRTQEAARALAFGGHEERLRILPAELSDRGGAVGAALVAGAELDREAARRSLGGVKAS